MPLIASHWLDACDAHWVATREVGLRQLVRAEEFIKSRARSISSLSDVAAHVGVSVRALQGAFGKHRGMTPYAFLTQCRLDEIHRELRTMDQAETIASVFESVGAMHKGRYAHLYHMKFGELPSATRARAQGGQNRRPPKVGPPRSTSRSEAPTRSTNQRRKHR